MADPSATPVAVSAFPQAQFSAPAPFREGHEQLESMKGKLAGLFYYNNDAGPPDKRRRTVCCALCGKLFGYYGSTTSLRYHLRVAHGYDTKSQESSPSPNPLSMSGFVSSNRITGDSRRPHEPRTLLEKKMAAVTDSIVDWLIDSSRPFSILNDPKFLEVLRAASGDAQFNLGHFQACESLRGIHDRKKAVLKAIITHARNIVLSVDTFSSSEKQMYVSVTAHILEDWTPANLCLAVHPVASADTTTGITSELASVVRSVAEEWEILGQVTALVTGDPCNASHSVAKETGFASSPCAGLSLCLAFDAGMSNEYAEAALQSSHKIAALFEGFLPVSVQGREPESSLTIHQEQYAGSRKPRWLTEFYVLESLIAHRSSFEAAETLANGCENENIISRVQQVSSVDWENVCYLFDLLSPLKQADAMLGSVTYATASVIPPLGRFMVKHYGEDSYRSPYSSENLPQWVCDVKATILNTFQVMLHGKFGPESASLAAVLDCRFKAITMIHNDGCDPYELLREGLEKEITVQAIKQGLECEDSDGPAAKKRCETATDNLFEFLNEGEERTNTAAGASSTASITASATDALRTQIALYKNKPSTNMDPLTWWKQNENVYPDLARVAQRVLCCPATTVPTQKLLTWVGFLEEKKMGALLPQDLETFIQCKSWAALPDVWQ